MNDVHNSIDHERKYRVPFYLKLVNAIPNPDHMILVKTTRALHT